MKNKKLFIVIQRTILILILSFSIGFSGIAQSNIINPAKKFEGNRTTVLQISQLAGKIFLDNINLKNNLFGAKAKISSTLLPLIDDNFLHQGSEMISYLETLKNSSQFIPSSLGYN